MAKYLSRILLISFGSLVGTSFGFGGIELVELRLFFFLQFPISSLIPFQVCTFCKTEQETCHFLFYCRHSNVLWKNVEKHYLTTRVRSTQFAVRFAQFVFIEYFFSLFDFSIDFGTHSFKVGSIAHIIGPNYLYFDNIPTMH